MNLEEALTAYQAATHHWNEARKRAAHLAMARDELRDQISATAFLHETEGEVVYSVGNGQQVAFVIRDAMGTLIKFHDVINAHGVDVKEAEA